jgi:uncharacterized membrane protein
MLLKNLLDRAQQGDRYFRWRGGDVSRLEALTDAVFALALTLLVVSLEVPKTFAELKSAFFLLPAFAICFALLLYVWVSHFRFHRRYGLEDGLTVTLNGVLLFLVLGYVYPLKFLFYWLWTQFGLADPLANEVFSSRGEIQTLMIAYGLGVAALFGTLWLLHFLAWRRREALQLTRVEQALTRGTMSEHAITVAIAVLSMVLAALSPSNGGLAGMIYFLMPVCQGLNGWRNGVKVDALVKQEEKASAAVDPSTLPD